MFPEPRPFLSRGCALLSPDALGNASLQGWEKASCAVAVAPAMGARFAATVVSMQHDGKCAGNTGAQSYLLYQLDGTGNILVGEKRHRLELGSYVFLPPGTDIELNGSGRGAKFLVFQKPFRALPGSARQAPIVSHEREVRPQTVQGAETIRAQLLLPLDPVFDFKVTLLTMPPGSSLPLSHPSTEAGFFVLRGEMIMKLGEEWGTARAGWTGWAAPFCQRWFAALGTAPASLMLFEDANRDPI